MRETKRKNLTPVPSPKARGVKAKAEASRLRMSRRIFFL